MMPYHDYGPYVSVAERRANAEREIRKTLGKGNEPAPIEKVGGRGMAKTFWGNAWCENLEAYSDLASRLPRGRTYARNGSIVHLEINQGKVSAYIAGSELYEVQANLNVLEADAWESFKSRCAGKIDTLLDLLQGKVADAVLHEITDQKEGLFPSPDEIDFTCSCPDIAVMCKHVAATLYGVGLRLDASPELFFTLRGVDHEEIIEGASAENLDANLPEHEDLLVDDDLGGIFGIDFSEIPEFTLPTVKKLRARRRR